MQLALLPHVRISEIGNDLVILDIAADAYFCLPGGARELRLVEQARAMVVDDAAADEWIASGFARAGAPDGVRPPPPLPSRGLVGAAAAPAACSWRDLVGVAASVADIVRRYRGRPFHEVLRFARRGGARDLPAQPAEDVLRLSAAFARAIVWAPIPGKCLARSFALLRFLQRRGFDAVWVFGVRTWPFGAHCWLQVGDWALDDTPEQLAAYTPILAV